MNFQNEKKQALEKLIKFDNSKKGEIDKQILTLITKINNSPNYYTTSSCAGRIMIIKPSKIKHDAEWLFSSHDSVKLNDILTSLNNLPKETVWLRMEPPIIHICSKDMDSADYLLKISNESGFRRSAILSFKKRIVIEIMVPEKMDVPISENGQLIVTKGYIGTLIEHANSKLKESRKKLKKLETLF